jgi:ribonuclease R
MEQVASNAERDSIKYKQVEFMSDKIGKVYDGVISGVTEWGIYVEINENKCEGMIPIREMDDDFYELDEKNFRLVGRRTKREYRLGQPVSIQVARANLDRKQLDFTFA